MYTSHLVKGKEIQSPDIVKNTKGLFIYRWYSATSDVDIVTPFQINWWWAIISETLCYSSKAFLKLINTILKKNIHSQGECFCNLIIKQSAKLLCCLATKGN